MRHPAFVIAFHLGLHIHRPVGLRRHENAVLLHVHLIVHLQPDMAIDARTRVPARLLLSVHMYHQPVFARLIDIRSDVEGETSVAIRMMAQPVTVQPDRGAMIHTVEVDAEPLVLR